MMHAIFKGRWYVALTIYLNGVVIINIHNGGCDVQGTIAGGGGGVVERMKDNIHW